MRLITPFLLLIFLSALLGGCDKGEDKPPSPAPEAAEEKVPTPPAPPIRETFDGKPQLSLFPRAGAFRPEDEDSKELAYWGTFMDHLVKTSGVIAGAGKEGSRAWSIRSIKGIDSVAFFSPLAVEPKTGYRVDFSMKGELPEKGEAGIGILEFDEFLWIGGQFTESLARAHLTGSHEGVRLAGPSDWEDHSFTFTTSEKTHMIHLILFREGEPGRKPVFFDDIAVTRAN